MKVLIICIAVIAISQLAEALEDGLKIKFGTGSTPEAGTEYFYDIPRSTTDAEERGWRVTTRPASPLPELVMRCPSDKVICALYDDIGDVAGLQIAFDKNSFTNNVFDWETRGFSLWDTVIDGQSVTMWTTRTYFVSAEGLKRSKKERLASRHPSRVLKENAVWVTGNYGELLRVSSSEADLIKQNLFTEQSCMAGMGLHYYYNMTSTIPCDAENMYPWFPLTLDDQLIAMGFLTVGNLPISTTGRDWFERPNVNIVQMIVPYGPQCLYDLVRNPGVITMHMYYTSTPWLITC